jgi:hypothetical protein
MSQSIVSDEIQIRKLMLDFYSSELTTHSRLIIGFSVLLFTVLNVIPNQKVHLDLQAGTYFFSLWLVAGALWYLFMRHISYGILSNATLHAPIESKNLTLKNAIQSVTNYTLHKSGSFPIRLFMVIESTRDKPFHVRHGQLLGLLICFAGFGTVTTILLGLLKGLI